MIELYPDALTQRCLVHKERNLKGGYPIQATLGRPREIVQAAQKKRKKGGCPGAPGRHRGLPPRQERRSAQ